MKNACSTYISKVSCAYVLKRLDRACDHPPSHSNDPVWEDSRDQTEVLDCLSMFNTYHIKWTEPRLFSRYLDCTNFVMLCYSVLST
jgi:hypothetical protein